MKLIVWGLLTACVGAAAAGCGSCGQGSSARGDDPVPTGRPIPRDGDAGHRNTVGPPRTVIRFDAGALP